MEWYIQINGEYIYASARDVTEKLGKEVKPNKLSVIDEFTGLSSKHFFDKRLVEEMERSDRYNDPLSMIILELFNTVSYTWGHPLRDEEIKQTAKIANSVIRKYDILVRLESKEFILLMPKTNRNSAIIVAEKIRKALNDNVHPIVGKFIASFGISERIKAESFKQLVGTIEVSTVSCSKKEKNCIISADNEEEFQDVKLKRLNGRMNGIVEIKKLMNSIEDFRAIK